MYTLSTTLELYKQHGNWRFLGILLGAEYIGVPSNTNLAAKENVKAPA